MKKEDMIKQAIYGCECNCYKCKYFKYFDCEERLKADAIKYIDKQEKEIERLKAKNKVLGDGVGKAFTNGFTDGRKQVEKDIRRAKIDVLNELKTRHDYAIKNMGYPWDISQQIDKLIKEVENE